MSSLPMTKQRDLVQRIPSFSTAAGPVTGSSSSSSAALASSVATSGSTAAAAASAAYTSAQDAAPGARLLRELRMPDVVLNHNVVDALEQYVRCVAGSSSDTATAAPGKSQRLPAAAVDALVQSDTNVSSEYHLLARLNKSLMVRQWQAEEFNNLRAERAAHLPVGFREDPGAAMAPERIQQDKRAAIARAGDAATRQLAARRLELLQNQIFSSYSEELAKRQFDEWIDSKGRTVPAIFGCLGSKQWQPILVELAARHPDCPLLECTVQKLAEALAEKDDFSELVSSRCAAWKPSVFVPLVASLVPKICNDPLRGVKGPGPANTLGALNPLPVHRMRERRIEILCALAHQSEAAFVYTSSLLTRVLARRQAAETAAARGSSGSPSATLLRLRHLAQRLRDWAWSPRCRALEHHAEHLALSRAMFRLSASLDPTLPKATKEAIATTDELRGRVAATMVDREKHRRETGDGSRNRLVAITTPALTKRLESVASTTVLADDSLAFDALLTDLVCPLVPLKLDHRTALISCVAAARVPDGAEHGRDRKLLATILSKVAKLCNRTPISSQLASEGAWAMFAELSNTRVVARALMIWIKECLLAPSVKDGMDYERSVFWFADFARRATLLFF